MTQSGADEIREPRGIDHCPNYADCAPPVETVTAYKIALRLDFYGALCHPSRHGGMFPMTFSDRPALEPGMWVRNPDRPDWGAGQVQSAIGERVTVNFAETGKLLVNIAVVPLEILEDPDLEPRPGDKT